ncbi:MAG: AmmeMemoRadiSam system protein B [Candidatus Omnitrophota bacterium]
MRKYFFAVIILASSLNPLLALETVKAPNASGQFYSADPKKLSDDIDGMLLQAKNVEIGGKIKILIVPHAGYIYSGGVAAFGYKAAQKNSYGTIVIVAPSHFSDFEGFSIWPQGSFETPLGSVSVDEEFSNQLIAADDRIKSFPQAFDREHALEVQIPFLQKTFSQLKIVPILTGRPRYNDSKALATALTSAIGEREDVLIVVSTDLSHYHDDATARRMDKATLAAIENFQGEQLWLQCSLKAMEMCGFPGVVTAIAFAKENNINKAEIIHYANSADVTNDKSSVVGYGAVAFYREDIKGDDPVKKDSEYISALTLSQKKELLTIARTTIEQLLTSQKTFTPETSDQRLHEEEGAFVTLHQKGKLRGCIGNILGRGPLYLTVRDMAIASATQDPRFAPVNAQELKDVEIEVSVLSKPRRITDINELEVGVHGAIVKRGFHQGLFLPQVATEFGWSKEEMLENLCTHKAGLLADAWKDPQTTIEIFSAQVFSEKDLR